MMRGDKRNGHVVSTRPHVAGDIEILKCLARHSVLTTADTSALVRRSYGAVIARINLLKRKPNELIQVHRTQLDQPRMYQCSPQALHLTNRGIAKLREIGVEVARREPSIHFLHQLTESQTAASFEIGARERLIPFSEILKSPSTPKAIAETGDHSIPVAFSYKGKDYKYNLTPDGRPFGIAYRNDTYRFFVFETDCASEPLVSSNRNRQAIETKPAAYLTVLENRLYETHLGLPNEHLVHLDDQDACREHDRAAQVNEHEVPQLFWLPKFPDHRQRFQTTRRWMGGAKAVAQVHGHLNLGEP